MATREAESDYPGIRTQKKMVSPEDWEKSWDGLTRNTPERTNPKKYLDEAINLYDQEKISEEEIRRDFGAFLNHPDEVVMDVALGTGGILYLCSQAKKGLIRPDEVSSLKGRTTEDMDFDGWTWDEALRRIKRDLAQENIVMSPSAGQMIAFAHWASCALVPKAPEPFYGRRGRSMETESNKSLEASRTMGPEIQEILVNFATWAEQQETWDALDAATTMDHSDALARVAWEHTPLVKTIAQQIDDSGPHLLERLKTLTRCGEAITGLFQNPGLDGKTLNAIVSSLASKDLESISRKGSGTPFFETAQGEQLCQEIAVSGRGLDTTTLEKLTKLSPAQGLYPKINRNLALLPQLCKKPGMTEWMSRTGDDVTMLRLSVHAPGTRWIAEACALSDHPDEVIRRAVAGLIESKTADLIGVERKELVPLMQAKDALIRQAVLKAMTRTEKSRPAANRRQGRRPD